MKRIPSLDGFRAIAIILVVITHSHYAIGFPQGFIAIAEKGGIGVTIFFVISGFLITYLLLSEEEKNGHVNLRAFYARRAFRIIPVYLLYLLFIFLWRRVEDLGPSPANLVHVLTFTVNFSPFISGFLGHLWTLSVEEQFYFFWPALLIIFRKHLKIILVVLILYSCAIKGLTTRFHSIQLITLSPFFNASDAIFVGSLGGIIFFENPSVCDHRLVRSYLSQIIALAVFFIFLFLDGYPTKFAIILIPFGKTIISLSVLFLIFANITPSNTIPFRVLNSRAAVHIGILSYSIYMWQQFFDSGNGDMHVIWRTFPLDILVVYVVSLASYYLWEKPFLRIKNRFAVNRVRQKKINFVVWRSRRN